MKISFNNRFLFLGILLITILSSCHTIKYENLELTRNNPYKYFGRKLNKTRADYNLIIHNSDDNNTAPIRVESQNAYVRGDSIYGNISLSETSELQHHYYDELVDRQKEGEAKMKLEKNNRDVKLNQLHIWVSQKVFEKNQNEIKMQWYEIKKIEKVEPYQRWKLWLFIGTPGAFVGFSLIYSLFQFGS